MLSHAIPNFTQEAERLHDWGPSGIVLALNMTFRGPEFFYIHSHPDWRRIYEENSYFYADPVLVWALSRSGERRWSEIALPDIRSVMVRAKAYDLNYGLVISRKSGMNRSFLTLSRPDREYTDTEIQVVAAKLEGWVEMVAAIPTLTAGELAVLRGLRDGLGQSQIAGLLRISESAVKQRCLKACSKLNAKTRTQAVGIAVARRYLDT